MSFGINGLVFFPVIFCLVNPMCYLLLIKRTLFDLIIGDIFIYWRIYGRFYGLDMVVLEIS